jgi:hypothetical protein
MVRASSTPAVDSPSGGWWRFGSSWVVLLAILAGALRLGLLAAGPAQEIERASYPDSNRYVQLAENIVETGSFALADEDVTGLVHVPLMALRAERGELEPLNAHGLRPDVVRTPGYPALIALVKWLGQPLLMVLLIQCMLDVLNVLLVYAIARRLLPSTFGAVLAAACYAIHPACIVFASALLSETLFVTCLLAGLWLSLVAMKRGSLAAAMGGGMLGLSVLVRPVSIVVGPILAVWLVVRRRAWRAAVVLLVASLLPAVGWMGRNMLQGSGPVLSSIPNIAAWYYTAAHMDITEAGGDLYYDWPEAVAVQHQRLREQLREGETVYAGAKRLALQRIAEDPKLYAKVLARSAGKTLTDHSVGKLYHQLGRTYQATGLRDQILSGNFDSLTTAQIGSLALPLAWSGGNALLVLLAVVGLARLLIARRWATLLLLSVLIGYFLFATQTNGLERFRMPMLGLQAIAAAATFSRLRSSHAAADSPAPAADEPTVPLRRAA